jgi:hypothetical protein
MVFWRELDEEELPSIPAIASPQTSLVLLLS